MKKLKIIAEIAQGFEGDKKQSKLLIKSAAVSGADYAKFQLVYADELATPDYKYYSLFKSLEFSDQVWLDISNYSANQNIKLIFDIFGEKSLSVSEYLKCEMIKLHATDISNRNLLNLVSKSKIPNIILGIGGAYLNEIEKALEILFNKNVILMLGFQGYPTHDSANQILRIQYLKEHFSKELDRLSFGFADHADPLQLTRYTIPAAALGAGATILEKHITLSKNLKLEDHESALNPDDFADFVHSMKSTFDSLGLIGKSSDFGMSEDERRYRDNIRRHVVANQSLNAEQQILPEHVSLKRTSSPDSITDLDSVYGKRMKKYISIDQPILHSDIISN
jgi:sialic acid synthase SpsE